MSENRYAVLIASSQFPNEPKLQALRCPENDVDGVSEILKTSGGFTETLVLKNQPNYEVLRKVNQVLKKAGKNDLILIYYSGHGKLDPAGRLHLATTDTVIEELEATSIPVERIRNFVDTSSPTKVILILDCCFSGAVEKAFLRSGVDDQLNLASQGRGTYIMTASTGIQVAQEREQDKYGVFTKHIIEGIRGGEADIDGDGRISMDELYSYVHRRVREDGFQEPMKFGLNVRGELVIAQSGRNPREERRKQIRDIMFDLSKQDILPHVILTKAIEVSSLTPTQLTGKLKRYDGLLDLLLKGLKVADFIDAWYRVEQEMFPAVIEEAGQQLVAQPKESTRVVEVVPNVRSIEVEDKARKESPTTISELVGVWKGSAAQADGTSNNVRWKFFPNGVFVLEVQGEDNSTDFPNYIPVLLAKYNYRSTDRSLNITPNPEKYFLTDVKKIV